MKSHITICTLLACVSLQAQQEDVANDPVAQPTSVETSVTDSVKSTRATPTIIGRLAGEPDLTPPRPAPPPPPRLLIPAENTLTSKTHNLGDHTVTIQEVIPVALLPRPAPKPPLTEAQKQAFRASRPPQPKRESICLSATVYDRRATQIQWRSKDNTQSLSAWSNIDFNYFRGISNIQQGDTQRSYFHFGIGSVNTAWLTVSYARFKRLYQKPIIPALPASPETDPTFIVVKGNPAPEDLVGIQTLHDLYKTEHARLKAAFEYQERKNQERASELRAHPPIAPDIIIKHWTLSHQATLPSTQADIVPATKGGAK